MESEQKTIKNLHKWNLFYFGLHGLAALIVGFVFSYNTNARVVDAYRGMIPNDLLHPTIDCGPSSYSGTCPNKYASTPIDRCKTINFPLICKKVASFDPSILLICFFLVTSIAHLCYALNFGNFYTNAVIKEGWNPYRWIEYFISASIMTFLISLIDGERNLNAATLMTIMTGVTQFQGFIVENNFLVKNASPEMSKILWRNVHIATWSGWLLFVGVWYVLVKNFFGVLNDANNLILQPSDKKVKIPIWVYMVVFSQAINFALFGFVQREQIKNHTNGKKFPYSKYEKQYMGLSFLAKFLLGAFVTYGIIQRTNGANC